MYTHICLHQHRASFETHHIRANEPLSRQVMSETERNRKQAKATQVGESATLRVRGDGDRVLNTAALA